MTKDFRPLVIADRSPLPAVTGGRQRMWNFLLAIDSLGPADLVVLDAEDPQSAQLIEAALPDWTVRFLPIAKRKASLVRRLFDVGTGRSPSAFAKLDLDGSAAELRSEAVERGLTIAIQPIPAAVAQRIKPQKQRLLVDLWDVEDARLARVNAAQYFTPSRPGLVGVWDTIRDRSDVRAWRRFNRVLLERASAVTVCSEIDRKALGAIPTVHVVPNGADLRPLDIRRLHDPPVILYHGQLTYPPNVDAARILVNDVLPLVRESFPTTVVRVVGRADDRVLRLSAPPAIVVTGFVDDIEPELARADLLVVPLRVGGGTRLKILEAFSAGLPVVATSIGAEGLEAENAVQLLVADDPAAMACAAIALLKDEDRRGEMRTAAHALVASRYDWRIIRAGLAELLRSLS